MKKWMVWFSFPVIVCLSACNRENEKLNAVMIVESQFQTTTENWAGNFSEYGKAETDTSLDISLGRTWLPVALDSTKYGFRIQGRKKGSNLFLFLKKKVTGLMPGRNYKIVFDIDLGTAYGDSTNASSKLIYLKAGASPNEPVKKLANSIYTVSIDKGQPAKDGTEMVILGTVSNAINKNTYVLVRRFNDDNPVIVKPDANGVIWLCVGVDTGYEGMTILYYDRIKATITEQFSD